MKNLILIGMPGTGKSAVGRELARRLEYTFLDVDDVIRERTGKTLKELLEEGGVDAFIRLEGQIGESLTLEDTVIATGGSMVLSAGAMDHLRENGVTVWLETPLHEIEDRMPQDLWDRRDYPPDLRGALAAVRQIRGRDRGQPAGRGRHGPAGGAGDAHRGHEPEGLTGAERETKGRGGSLSLFDARRAGQYRLMSSDASSVPFSTDWIVSA